MPAVDRPVPEAEISRRLDAFQAALRASGLDGALIVQTVGIYYLAGTAQTGHLVVPADGEPALLVRRSVERARAESPLRRVEPLRSLRGLPDAFASVGLAGGRIGLELDVVPAALFAAYGKILAGYELGDCSLQLRRIRAIRSELEIGCLRRAAAVIDDLFAYVPDVVRDGMTGLELSAELDRFLRRRGSVGLARFRGFNQEMVPAGVFVGGPDAAPGCADTPLVGWGVHPSVPKGPSATPIGPGVPVVVDVACALEGYQADATRTFVLGALPDDMQAAYERARSILHAVAGEARPGVAGSSLYDQAHELADGIDGFMGTAEERVSFVGHGVGLEIDELPFLAAGHDAPLEAGMVFALEPKFVFPGRGAVGVENTYVVRAGGAESLNAAPDGVVEVA